MLDCFAKDEDGAVPLTPVGEPDLAGWLDGEPARLSTWLRAMGFQAKAGAWCGLPDPTGRLEGVAVGLGERADPWSAGGLAHDLPQGTYRLDGGGSWQADFVLGWALGAYRFERYRKGPREPARLVLPASEGCARAARIAEAVCWARDLINTPAGDMGPVELAEAATSLAAEFAGTSTVTVGDDLLAANFPAIHAVGRASSRAPRLIDLAWGDDGAPKVTLVGKGVCFDSGGLDLKPAQSMLRMKKDMGGAACVLAVARMVMAENLAVRLRVLIPAVDNAVDGNAYRPMDVVASRQGLAIEIGDTDAEGRVILADALSEAASASPDLIVDMATLTGAARTALGTDLPALFANDKALSRETIAAGSAVGEDLWPIPIWQDYRERLKSDIADIANIANWDYADHIQAALFLESFVGTGVPWLHVDTFCWQLEDRPGRPKGGDPQGARAVFELLRRRYGAGT
jgi:leucyl aminopeptidase